MERAVGCGREGGSREGVKDSHRGLLPCILIGSMGTMPIIPMSVIHKAPETMGGVPAFRGTRVPLDNLFDALEHGKSVDDFVESFPTVTREQAIAALFEARAALVGKL